MNFKNWYLINEIDWKSDFSDVDKTCEDPKKIVDYLNAVYSNRDIEYGDREKFPSSMPFVHSKSEFFNKEKKELDIDYFIKQITSPPKTIINTNEKILKSGGNHEFVYKTGIPAFRGIVYDLENKKFIFINTCPGAGKCVAICYARKGRYIQYPQAYDSMTRRLNYLLNFPKEYENQMHEELKLKCEEHKAYIGYKSKVIVRWNDSGDFFTQKYVQIAERVLSKLKKENYNIDSYAYTKVAAVANKSPFDATFSVGGNQMELKKVKKSQKKSEIIPSQLFKDLDLMKISDEELLKQRISKHYKIPIENLITYDELISKQSSNNPIWNVIVTPNDGDDAAFRKDVKLIFLTQH